MSNAFESPGLPDADHAVSASSAHKLAAPAQQATVALFFPTPGQYRRELFTLWEDNFVIKFERNVEPGLILDGANPYPHAFTVMRACRTLLRLKANRHDGTLQWGRGAARFTADDTLMISRQDLVRACRVFKPCITGSQVRRGLEVLKRFGILWSKQGRPQQGSKHYGSPGTIMYLRVNTGRLLALMEGGQAVTPCRLSCARALKRQRRSVVLDNTGKGQPPVAKSVKASPAGESPKGNCPWPELQRRTPATLSPVSSSQMVFSEREQEIINLITKTPHLFVEMDGWSRLCTNDNVLTVGQALQVRTWMHRKVLTLEFMKDYVEQVTEGTTRPDGEAYWWQRCTIEFWLKNLKPVRAQLYKHLADVSQTKTEILNPNETPDESYALNLQAAVYGAITIVPGQVLSASDLRLLSTAPCTAPDPDPVSQEAHVIRRAMLAITAVQRASEVEDYRPGSVEQVTNACRPDVIKWLKANPRFAQQVIARTPNFCFWFGITTEIQNTVNLASAHILNSRAGQFITNRLAAGW